MKYMAVDWSSLSKTALQQLPGSQVPAQTTPLSGRLLKQPVCLSLISNHPVCLVSQVAVERHKFHLKINPKKMLLHKEMTIIIIGVM